MSEEQRPEQQPAFQIMVNPEQMAGVWANFAQVSHSLYEFTLDFARIDFSRQPPVGVLVARVSVSPLFIDQLITALQSNWAMYAEKALPKEVYGESGGIPGSTEGPGPDPGPARSSDDNPDNP